jgi:hypothetical protein
MRIYTQIISQYFDAHERIMTFVTNRNSLSQICAISFFSLTIERLEIVAYKNYFRIRL